MCSGCLGQVFDEVGRTSGPLPVRSVGLGLGPDILALVVVAGVCRRRLVEPAVSRRGWVRRRQLPAVTGRPWSRRRRPPLAPLG